MTAKFLPLLRSGEPGGGIVACVAPASPARYFYSELIRCMPPSVRAYGAEPSPILIGQVPHQSVTQVADIYATELLNEIGSEALILYGLCMGGFSAIEVAQQLSQRGAPPRAVVLVDTFYPHRTLRVPNGDFAQRVWIQFVATFLSRDRGQLLLEEGDIFWPLSYGEKLERICTLANESRTLLLPRPISTRALQSSFEGFATWLEEIHSISPGDYSGNVLYFRSQEFRAVHERNLFMRHLVGAVRIVDVAANHESLMRGDSVLQIAQQLPDLLRWGNTQLLPAPQSTPL